MANKAKFIREYTGGKYEPKMIYRDYEYRGHEYTVYENLGKGNIPLSWQHKNYQAEIDRQIELDSKPVQDGKQFDLDEIWHLMGWDE